MKLQLKSGISLVFLISIAAPCFGQVEPESTTHQGEAVVLTINEVIVDIVVRDKKGRLATDLGARDFQVFEDKVPQKIESFRFVGSEPSVCRSDGKDQGVALIAMVFDRISPESCPFVYAAAMKYVTETIRPSDLVGVFGTNLSLQVFQSYTNNVELMKAGIRRALSQCASGAYASGKASDQTTALMVPVRI